MVRSLREIELEPVRVVVELTREQFQALDRRSRRLGVPALLRVVALRLAGLGPERGEGLVVEEPLGNPRLARPLAGQEAGYADVVCVAAAVVSTTPSSQSPIPVATSSQSSAAMCRCGRPSNSR